MQLTNTSTTRGAKAKILAETIKRPGLEFVQVDDLIDSDLTEALKGMCSDCPVQNSVVAKRSLQMSLLLFMLPHRFLEKQAYNTPLT